MDDAQRDRHLGELAARLPGVEQGRTVHHPSLRCRNKAFVMVSDHDEESRLWIKSDLGTQEALIAEDPERYFRPPYVGHHGWVGVHTGPGADWSEIEELVVDAFRLVATKKQIAEYDAGG